jgi:predicted SprT family Zn-dependent metalloprotease
MFATQEEIDQYCRMTLKQHGFADYKVVFMKLPPRRLGQANPWKKRIELTHRTLANFALFKLVFLHELAHVIQFYRMGETYRVNGRNNFHGKVFKECCKELKISHKTKIPV